MNSTPVTALVPSAPAPVAREVVAPPQPAQGDLNFGQIVDAVREELQLYRGDFIEKMSDRIAIGKSTFDSSTSVAKNLEAAAREAGLQTFYRRINGREVLHVVVDLGEGKDTEKAIRSVLRRVGQETIELNYKAPKKGVAYGHVAVRVGGGAFYDLTGTRGVAELPPAVENLLKMVTGREDLALARRRNYRRFFESRSRDYGPMVFAGLLFAAKPNEQRDLRGIYEHRLKTMTGFDVSGGDAKKGVYSCAQYLSEDVPFWNERGVGSTIAASGFGSSGMRSPSLEAVVIYKTRDMSVEEAQRKLP